MNCSQVCCKIELRNFLKIRHLSVLSFTWKDIANLEIRAHWNDPISPIVIFLHPPMDTLSCFSQHSNPWGGKKKLPIVQTVDVVSFKLAMTGLWRVAKYLSLNPGIETGLQSPICLIHWLSCIWTDKSEIQLAAFLCRLNNEMTLKSVWKMDRAFRLEGAWVPNCKQTPTHRLSVLPTLGCVSAPLDPAIWSEQNTCHGMSRALLARWRQAGGDY